MERLSFTSKAGYNATEASIHLARYLLAAPYVNGRRVLDVACGEGYGAFALKLLGAKNVEAIDISPEAIIVARTLFAAKNITYHVHDAQHVDKLFRKGTFDVIVSLETVEHVRDPERFLRAVKAVAKRDAVIIISCPNDHWYYKDDSQSNPFHLRKYSFEQFRELTTSIFGDGMWGYGVPIVGFGNIRDDLSAGRDPLAAQAAMLDFRRQASAVALPPRVFSNVGPRNCSYFIGIWGGNGENIYTSAFAPISMEQYSNLVSWEVATERSPAQIDSLERENATLKAAQEGFEGSLNDIRERCETALERAQLAQSKLDEARLSVEARDGELARLSEQVRSLEAAAQQEVAALKTDLEGAHGRQNQMEKEAERHRIQALALAKELEVSNHGVSELAGERDRLQGEVESWRAAERVACLNLTDMNNSLEEVRLRLELLEKESEGYRIQALALAKELEVSNHRVGELAGERDRLLIELQNCRTAEAALRQEIIIKNKESEEFPNLRDPVPTGSYSGSARGCVPTALEHGAHQGAGSELADPNGMKEAATAETFRIQAFALSKELSIATSKIDELMREREHLLTDPSSAIASLLKEKKALEWQLNTVMKVSNSSTRQIRSRVTAAVKSRLRRVARRVRPYLPRRLLFAAQAVARSVGM